MSEPNKQQELSTAKYLENSESTAPLDPIIYGPKPTPSATPLGNLPLVAGACAFVLVAASIFVSYGETQKAESERNGWYKWLVDYSVEKQEREGRAPKRSSESYGPFGY